VLTVSGAEDDVVYAADVYNYSEDVTDAANLNDIMSLFELAGVGLGAADNGTLEIGLQTPDGADFTSDGTFLMVLTSTDKDSSTPLKYKAAVPFTGGSAALKYEDMETVTVEPSDPSVPSYTVTFNLNYTGAPNPPRNQKINEGGKATKPSPDPTREDYTLDGWYTSTDYAAKWEFDTHTVTTDINLYAKWLDNAIIYRTVTFHTNGGTPADFKQTAENGGKVTIPTAPTLEGYTFDGWYTSTDYAAKWDFDTRTVTTDIDLYAKWLGKSITYRTITFNLNYTGATNTPPNQEIGEGGKITPPNVPVRAGYIFGGWFTDAAGTGAEWDFDTRTVTTNLDLYAKWLQITYTVTFSLSEAPVTAPVHQAVPHGGKITEPNPAPQWTGFTFVGWYTTTDYATKWNFDSPIIADITLYARWTRNTYKVTFDTGNVEPTPVPLPAVPYEDKITVSALTKTGYTFDGWYKNAAKTTKWDFGTDTVKGDITLYGTWTQITYIVTFNLSGAPGTAPAHPVVPHGGKISEPTTELQWTGYTFGGWYRGAAGTGAKWNFVSDTVTENIALYAKWSINYHTVTFNSAGGSIVPALEVPYGSAATRPGTNPTREGYDFDDWYTSTDYTTKWNFSSPVTANVTIYANWKPTSLAAFIAEMAKDAGLVAKAYTMPSGSETYNGSPTLTTANCPASTTINGGGRVITGNGNTNGIVVGAGITLTVTNLTLHNIKFTVDGTLVLGDSVFMSGFDSGARVSVRYGGEFEMRAGAHITQGNYGSVALEPKGSGSVPPKFTMKGGKISGATGKGGVYMLAPNSVFTMSDGEISGNTNSGWDGGGVVIEGQGSVFTMNGGAIKNNVSTWYGGGVGIWVAGVTFTMNAGVIQNNTAGNSYGGGGVFVYLGASTFTMTGGTISNNSAGQGGGVLMYTGVFNMLGGVISNNTASNDGGGVYANGGTKNHLFGDPQIGGTNPGAAKGWIHSNTPNNTNFYQ
jgi:uncharacterized repeat protein (TIGR02543 family)